MTTIKPLMTTAEVAEVLRETPENVARRCASGQLPATRISGEWRIHDTDLAEFIAPSNVRVAPRVRSSATRRRSA